MEAVLWMVVAAGLGLLVIAVLASDQVAGFRTKTAARRAEELLRRVLHEEQYQALQTVGYLEVPSRLVPNRVYRIRRCGPIEVCEDGRRLMWLCLQPACPLPSPDVVLLHKVLLEGNESSYLRTANVVDPWGRPLPGR